jgi:ABC-2 type transport system ATP-binding protein
VSRGADELTTTGTDCLELRGLTRRFGTVVALDRLSFAVEPAQLYGFVGANGAGKTTAMRVVMGIDRPDEGDVLWRGAPPGPEVRSRFGYMPEERGLYQKMSAAAQLTYLAQLHDVSRPDARRSAYTWLERLGLGERADEPVERLSQGNQQRVQLAAALVHDPHLLILDEPFSGLDPMAVDTMSAILVEYAHERGVPVLFSSHQLELVERLCDAVAIIDRGRLVASGQVTDLRRHGRRREHRLRIDVEHRPTGPVDPWAQLVAGVEVVDDLVAIDVRRTVVRLADPGRVARDAVLNAAMGAGSVVRFEVVRPTLTELYRDAVQQHDGENSP